MSNGAPTFQVKTHPDADDLLQELRDARKRSERTGGAYSVYRLGEDGKLVVSVMFHLPPRPVERKKVKGGR